MKVHYLEVVTTDVEAAVSLYSKIHNIPENAFKTSPELGNARTVELDDSSTLGIRQPMHDAEKSVVRPYTLVDDINDAIEKIKDIEGVVIAVPPMPIEGRGQCAIYIQDGIEFGLWDMNV